MAFADSLWSAVLFFSLAGLGHSACWSPVVALVQRWVPDRQRCRILGIVTLGSGVGIAIWGFLLLLIVSRFGWRTGWGCLGLIGFGVAVLNVILVSPPEDAKGDPDGTGIFSNVSPWQKKRPYLKLLCDLRLWRIGMSYLFVGFTVMVPYTFLSVYATEGLALPFSSSTRLIAIIAVAGMIGKVVLGFGSDITGRLPMMVLCNVTMGLGCLGLTCFSSLAWLTACAVVFGLGFGAVWPLYAAAAPDFFSRKETPAA
jgi:MFS family permease